MKEFLESPEIFKVRFDNMVLEQASQKAQEMLQSDSWHYIAGTNANLLRMARRNQRYRDAINRADLSLADGYGVICASRILGTPLLERVACIDLLDLLLPQLQGVRVFLLGGEPGRAQKAAERLQQQYPGLVLCGFCHGYQDADEMAKAAARCRPDLLLVCLGSPKQELWMAEYGPKTGARLACGCGGWIDICAGKLKRAPESWRRRNLEWAFRLLQEPWRIGRVFLSLSLPFLAFWEAAGKKLAGLWAKEE